MITETNTLTLNAAFLQEIKEDNYQLRELFRKASHLLSTPRRVPLSSIVGTLTRLRDQLAMHFALENAYGYLDGAIDLAPRLCQRARLLRAEHEVLYTDFCELSDGAEELLHQVRQHQQVTRLAVLFFDFQARFQAHEACENELIFEAFDDDVGVGD